MEFLPAVEQIAEEMRRDSGMDVVGVYRFTPQGLLGCSVGVGTEFTQAYESHGIHLDSVLAHLRCTGRPCSTVTLLGERWTRSPLYRGFNAGFGIEGFATLPLYRGDDLMGVLYFAARRRADLRRLDWEGLCGLTAAATRVSTRLLRLPSPAVQLTPRQHAVARLAAAGLPNKEIARRLATGEAAVRKHLKALNRFFDTRNRTAMAAAWRESGH